MLGVCLSLFSHSTNICWVCGPGWGRREGGRPGGYGCRQRPMDLNSCGMSKRGWEGSSLDLFHGVIAPAPTAGSPALSFLTHKFLVSSASWLGGILHSHVSLPHAGGPVNSRSDAARGSSRNSVLPVPKPHATVGPPGKMLRMGAGTWLWKPFLAGHSCSWPTRQHPFGGRGGVRCLHMALVAVCVPSSWFITAREPGGPRGPYKVSWGCKCIGVAGLTGWTLSPSPPVPFCIFSLGISFHTELLLYF